MLGIGGIPGAGLAIFSILALVFGLIAVRRVGRGETEGFGLALGGVVLGAIGLMIGVTMWVVFIVGFQSEKTTPTKMLQPGDCLVAPVDAETARVRACEAPHRFEVMASLDDSTETTPEYPGREVLREHARERCAPFVEGYLGTGYDPSGLTVRAVVPTAEQWTLRGERWFVCLLERADGDALEVPLRGIGFPS